ncbi:group II intron maturase-specific domain-containing protein [Streptomyces tauricus]|uniref:group II intron maturase-specific domain-containing protein n=1 Tax=Streptomyces tauricus TaxID=68274 RepID=UPI0033AF2915
MLPDWCAYFRPGVFSATFQYLNSYTWSQVMKWLRRKHCRITWKDLRRYCGGGWRLARQEQTLFAPGKCAQRATVTGARPSLPPKTLFHLVRRRWLMRLVAMAVKARKCSGLRS